ncbi:flagellar MS-ring protein [Rubripirellula obstinata]|uniref:Flagellar MS-ring protein n=1 Tax=Rubripirellula obstinata TaxID=406547 RepID=A0A5B1CGA8_9BACT|nr:beta-cystathionase [Rubripirellula obstinata]KAA1260227.1 flagellar MS-ring protein [Rubripirellula obstinata]
MSFIKESTDQAREAFVSMPMQSRVITVMLGAAIAIGLAFLVKGDATKGTEFLFGGQSFSAQELAATERAFSRAGLNAWQREGQRILIPSDSKSEYLSALEDSSTLPMSMHSRVQDAIDSGTVFDSSDLRASRESVAKEQELASTIMSFDDVRMAKVEHDRGERVGLGRKTPQSCSVFVQPDGSSPLPRGRIMAITELIKASYAGMSADDVKVIDANATGTSSLVDEEDPMLRKQKEAEDWVYQKVKKLLAAYPAVVEVAAEIDPTMDVEKTVLKYDAEPTNLYSNSKKIEAVTNREPNGGVPGTGPNAVTVRSGSVEETYEATKTKEDNRESRGVAGQQYENSRLASLQVKQVKVSVSLPRSFYERQHKEKQLRDDPDIDPADIRMTDTDFENLKTKTEQSIQDTVLPLLPSGAAGADMLPLVSVTVFPDAPVIEAASPQTAKIALTWLSNSWQTLAMVALGLIALLVARSAAKGGGGSAPTDFSEGFGLELPQPPPEVATQMEDPDSMTITGGSLKDELLILVEDNPEVAANVIRGWIGDAA